MGPNLASIVAPLFKFQKDIGQDYCWSWCERGSAPGVDIGQQPDEVDVFDAGEVVELLFL